MSPFDEARYARLLEGLEIAEIRFREAMDGTDTSRIDPEYFNHAALETLKLIKGNTRLGDLVQDGYRVVYETTEAIEREVGEREGLPFFLQAADITTPFINVESMICVAEVDWVRYPKGRIQPGELLIEVKGKAEKIALVPDDFPPKTLVTGTCFKLTTKDRVDQYFLAAYLTCRYGQILKDRLKSNLLVSYLAKDDLYGLPVPDLSASLKGKVQVTFEACFARHRDAEALLKSSEVELLRTLGLVDWTPPEKLTYVRSSSDAFTAARFDAEYFHPAKIDALEKLSALSDFTVGDLFNSVRELWQPDDDRGPNVVRNYDLTDALSPFLDGSKEPSDRTTIASTKKRICAGDLVVSRLRSYLKEIALVQPGGKVPMVASTEFIVLRPKHPGDLSVEALMIYLRSALPQTVFKWSQDGSNHPRFDEKELLRLPVPRILIQQADKYVAAVRSVISQREQATRLLDAAKRAVEIAIEQDEKSALTYLDSQG